MSDHEGKWQVLKENGRFCGTIQKDMHWINIEDIWVAQISEGVKGLRGVGEDERLDNTNNRWAGWWHTQ